MLLAVLTACAGYANIPGPSDRGTGIGEDMLEGRVARVVDGETFWLDSADTSIRVWALDSPEVGQPDGARATAALDRLIVDRDLSCRQRDIDRYGRIVGQCFLADGRDTTAVMIASRTAREYCRYSGNAYGTC